MTPQLFGGFNGDLREEFLEPGFTMAQVRLVAGLRGEWRDGNSLLNRCPQPPLIPYSRRQVPVTVFLVDPCFRGDVSELRGRECGYSLGKNPRELMVALEGVVEGLSSGLVTKFYSAW